MKSHVLLAFDNMPPPILIEHLILRNRTSDTVLGYQYERFLGGGGGKPPPAGDFLF